MPESFTETNTISPFSVVSILMMEFLWENLIALSVRLAMTCCILPISAETKSFSPERISSMEIFFSLQRTSKVSHICLMAAFMSKSDMVSTIPLLLSEFSSKSPLVSFVSLSVSLSTTCRYFSCISGGMVPSIIAFRYPLIEVRGDLKS